MPAPSVRHTALPISIIAVGVRIIHFAAESDRPALYATNWRLLVVKPPYVLDEASPADETLEEQLISHRRRWSWRQQQTGGDRASLPSSSSAGSAP